MRGLTYSCIFLCPRTYVGSHAWHICKYPGNRQDDHKINAFFPLLSRASCFGWWIICSLWFWVVFHFLYIFCIFRRAFLKKKWWAQITFRVSKNKKVFAFGGEWHPIHAEPCLQPRSKTGLLVEVNWAWGRGCQVFLSKGTGSNSHDSLFLNHKT